MNKFSKFFGLLIGSALLVNPLMAMALTSPVAATASKTVDQSTVVVKFKADTDASLTNNTFVSPKKSSINKVNDLLVARKASKKKALVSDTKQSIKQNRSKTKTALPENQGDLQNYYTISLGPGANAQTVAAELKQLDTVETAYAKPLPAPSPASPSFSQYQTYMNAAPTGLGVNSTVQGSLSPYPGSTGNAVKVAVLEYSWNTAHEDLSRLRSTGAVLANGTPVDPFNDAHHGTAVAGVITADRNTFGTNGIVPFVQYYMVNTNNAERGWDVANAVYLAANNLSSGDVILLEQQAWAPDGQGFAPIEIYQDVYDAVVYATAKGIHVVEPAGNGNFSTGQGYNLGNPMFGSVFTTGRPNSNAIIVGASATGCSYTAAGARMAFSNYGSRVNVRAPGECVVTTGYGDLYFAGQNMNYTSNFGGTSSASAIIAGVAAELSSTYEQLNGTYLSPASLRAELVFGGTLQNTSMNPGAIGRMPNMAKVLPRADVTGPTAPSGLVGSSSALNRINLSWSRSTDNLSSVKYSIYRNNVKIATTTNLSFVDKSVVSRTTYTYTVTATDISGNTSPASNSVSIKSR